MEIIRVRRVLWILAMIFCLPVPCFVLYYQYHKIQLAQFGGIAASAIAVAIFFYFFKSTFPQFIVIFAYIIVAATYIACLFSFADLIEEKAMKEADD